MKFSTKNILQKAIRIFFVLSLVIIAFSLSDTFLKWYEILQITIPYAIVWLVITAITLLLVGDFTKMEKVFSYFVFGNWELFILLLCGFFFSNDCRETYSE